MASGSIASNPTTSNIDITDKATSFLWAVFAIMLVSSIAFLVAGSRLPIGQRAFHHLSGIICATAAIAYFLMAADLGSTPIPVEFIRSGYRGAYFVSQGIAHPTRSIWYVRYIDWVITTPLLLLELLLATALPLSDIATIIFFDIVMIITGLVGSLVHSQYKWGLFTFGMAAEIYIWYSLFVPARTSTRILGDDYHKSYLTSAIVLSSLWLLYPLFWGLADGGNVISPNLEMFLYGFTDILAKPVFCFIHLNALKNLDYARLGLSSGKFSVGMANDHIGSSGSTHTDGYNHHHHNHEKSINNPSIGGTSTIGAGTGLKSVGSTTTGTTTALEGNHHQHHNNLVGNTAGTTGNIVAHEGVVGTHHDTSVV